MTEQQQDFFRRLCAPFPPSQVRILNKGGRTLHYITSRTLTNRLDEVCGPTGWYPEYRPMERGFTCRLHLRVPDDDGNWVWMYKEDGGGFAGMQERAKDGTLVTDDENDEKSGYTDSLKRAGAIGWGIGRYLYRDGVPTWLGDQPPPSDPPRETPAHRQEARREGPYDESDGAPTRREGRPATAPAPSAAGRGERGRKINRPKTGKQFWAFVYAMQERFGIELKGGVGRFAKRNKFPYKSEDWTEGHVNRAFEDVVNYLKTLDNYGGEFDDLYPPPEEP
ncbi:MAG: hypothetical protein IRY99_27790, partial [Isosphaeraceae bacterium]|nr:hypothetical protein [Isosphaeraceae bacterium]